MAGGHAVYGIELLGLDLEPGGPPAPASWPTWTIAQVTGPADDAPGLSIWETHARIGFPGTGELRLDRADRTITLHAAERWSDAALLHPVLSPAAMVIAHWMGRACLHASAVLVDGRAWGMLGDHGAGKSTTAALLATRGCDLLTDDLLVIEGETCFAGPAAVDLREDAAAELGGEPLGRLGYRERWRKQLHSHKREVPLAGWIELAWSANRPEFATLEVSDRLELLSGHTGLPMPGEHLLALADRPILRFSRPRSLTYAAAGSQCLMRMLEVQRR